MSPDVLPAGDSAKSANDRPFIRQIQHRRIRYPSPVCRELVGVIAGIWPSNGHTIGIDIVWAWDVRVVRIVEVSGGSSHAGVLLREKRSQNRSHGLVTAAWAPLPSQFNELVDSPNCLLRRSVQLYGWSVPVQL